MRKKMFKINHQNFHLKKNRKKNKLRKSKKNGNNR